MSGDFLDTNVFLYVFAESSDPKRSVATRIVSSALASGGAVTSFQVVQEALNAMVSKFDPPAKQEDVEAFLSATLIPLASVVPSFALYQSALRIRDRYQFHFYDALIVAAALEAGCSRLLTEDLHHGQVIDRMTIENPFR